MNISSGFENSIDKNIKSRAYALRNSFVYPENTGILQQTDDELYFAGGDGFFNLDDLEVWGLDLI